MKKKVRITGLPTGQSGLEVKMDHLRAGLGFNSNVMPWPIMAGKMSAPPIKVNSKLKPIPREEANLEAEKDEVAMIPGQGSIPDTYTIGGKRHTQGGTPLNLPENSFIFSDTAKMRIKDPAVLAQFGLSPKKNGYTPAEIAKKYNTAPYKKILADKNTDDLQRETAELMLSNFNLKLGKLALIQESMKGFPQGIPEIAMPYLEAMEINPEDLMQQNPGAPQEGEDAAGQESAMEIGGPVMAQQPGAPLQYLQDGGPDYFAMGGLKRYQTAGAVKEEPNRYKDISNWDNYQIDNPYDFYNIQERIWDSYKGTDKRLGQVDDDAIKKLDEQIALINSYKETQPEVYKNLLPRLDRLIKSKQQGSELGLKGSGDRNEFELGEPYVHPDIQAASDAYPVMPAKEPTPGFGGGFGVDDEDDEQEFAGTYKDDYEAYMDALKSNDPKKMATVADQLISRASSATPWYSAKWYPNSNADKFQDLANILYEKAYPKAKPKTSTKNIEAAKSAKEVYQKVYDEYAKLPAGPAKQELRGRLDTLSALHPDYLKKHVSSGVSGGPSIMGTVSYDANEFTPDFYNAKDYDLINKYKQAYLQPKKDTVTKVAPKTNTVQEAGFKPKWTLAQLDSAIAADEAKPKKRYGGATKKVRITGLPSSLQKAQYGSTIPVNSPLMQPGVQLDFNNPNYAAQAAINTNYSLDATIPETSPLKKPATKLDFTASDATKPTNTENKNLAYKDTQIKWGPKYGVSGPATAQGIISGMDFISSLGRNKEMLALEQKMKEKQFSMFTPEAGNKGSWVQSGMAYGLQNPNSNIVQQPGYMTMRRNTFGYGKSEFGGAMDQYKLGGFTTVNTMILV